MFAKKFSNIMLESNSYILHDDEFNEVYIIDPGDVAPLSRWIANNKKKVAAVFLTHCHIDHIYGLNELLDAWPSAIVYASEASLSGLASPKMNGSYYMGSPYMVEFKNIEIITTKSKIPLFGESTKLEMFETPGHNDDCVSFKVNRHLFTGDALIPNNKVHTRSKNASKEDALKSIIFILKNFSSDTIVCPGHGDTTRLNNITLESVT